MKKKLILLVMVLVAVAIGSSATVIWVGHCGVEVVTVSPNSFETAEEALEYYESLNEMFCGSSGGFILL